MTEFIQRKPPSVKGYVLRVIAGPDKGKEVILKSEAAEVGVGKDCTLTLTDKTVSQNHVRIEVEPHGLSVTDLGSTNGTFYLETRINQAMVPPGAVITLGETKLALVPEVEAHARSVGESRGRNDEGYGKILGTSPAMSNMFTMLEQLEENTATVLLLGETGVGKELVAHEIHAHSPVGSGPFQVLDCGAVAPSLAESELFGHKKGAFTGADRDHKGLFERANGGTAFLDEVGELPLELQPKLLRVLESQQFRAVGGDSYRSTNVRVIAATNRDLSQEVEEGRFRKDLYFRLNVVSISIPPLRERRADIPTLVASFLHELGVPDFELSPGTVELMTSGYDWPGNVRELRNALTRVVAVGALPEWVEGSDAEGATGEEEVPPSDAPKADLDEPFIQAKKRFMDAFEYDYLSSQLDRAGGSISKAARLSSMDRTYFKRLLRRHGLLGDKG